jgi:hypothetical protein
MTLAKLILSVISESGGKGVLPLFAFCKVAWVT